MFFSGHSTMAGDGLVDNRLPLVFVYRLDSAPLQFRNEQGQPDGLFIDLWKLWSEKTGIPIRFVGAYNREAQQLIRDGQADVLAGLFVNPRRKTFLDFSQPVLKATYYVYVRDSLEDVQSVEDLVGYRVGVTASSYHEDYLRSNYPDLSLVLYSGYEELFKAIADGEVDAIVTQPIYLQHRYARMGRHVALKRLQPALYDRAYRAAVSKGRIALLKIIDRGLAEISAEERTRISGRWTGLGWTGAVGKQLDLTEEERTWLKQHPVIPVGGESDWPPFDFTNEKGRHQGVAAEYLKKMEELLGVRFEVETRLPWQEVLDRVRRGELYFACTMVATPSRRRDFLFTQPYYSSPAAIVVRRDNGSIQGLADLADKRVAIVRGYSVSEYLRRRFPGFTQVEVNNLLEGLEAVQSRKADAVLDNQDVLAWLMEEHAIPDMRLIRVKELFRGNTNLRMGVSRKYPLLAEILQKALDAIPEDEQQRFLGKWLPAGSRTDVTERVYLSLEEQKWISEHPRIRIGVDPAWPPVEYLDSEGRYKGMASDYVSLLVSWLGLETEVSRELDWGEIMEAAREGRIDLLPAVVATEERRAFLDFTRPYMRFPVVIFTRRHAPLITGLSELEGQKVAVEKGYVMEEILQKKHPSIELVRTDTTLAALKDLAVGKVEAYVGNLATASTLLQQHGLGNIKVAAPTNYNLDLRMGVRKDWPQLVAILDKLLGSISEEQRSAIRKKWLQVDYDVQMDYQLLWRVVALSLFVVLVILIWMYQIRAQKERLQKNEEQLTRILQAVPIPIVVADLDGRLVLANPQVAVEMESSEGDMTGRNMNEFYADPRERQEIIARLMRDRRVDRFPVHLRTDRGNMVEGLMSAIPIELEGRILHLGMFFNLTDRLRMEKELASAKIEAERANAFKSRFLANMSHEIRTPMNAILGLAHLCSRTSLDAKQRNYLEHMESSARTLLNIINDILDLSRIEAGRIEIEYKDFALWEVLEQVGTLCAVAAADKGLELLFRVQPGVPEHCRGDALHLAQVLINLVQNAIKFTENGEVVVDIAMTSRSDSTATLLFSVRDTGIGIAKEDIPYLFDAFTQVDQSYRRRFTGTGLGLAISKTLVELMGGNIEVQSEPGKGSCFRFFLSLDLVPDENEVEGNNLLAGKRVLVVEKNVNARMILGEMLQGFGMEVQLYATPAQLLEEMEQQGNGQTDVLILGSTNLDESMKARLQALVAQGLHLFVLQNVGEEMLFSPEAAGYLHKPVIPWLLQTRLLSLIQGQEAQWKGQGWLPADVRRLKGEVLLVEDNRINQLVAREILEQFGLFVQVAASGNEALEMLSGKTFDLVFMDIQMPDMDGYQVVRHIREELGLKDLPVIAMTAHALKGDREKSLQAGMNDHLSKPIDPRQLWETLSNWLPEDAAAVPRGGGEPVVLPFQLEHVDVQWGLERTGGNQALFRRLLQQFLEDHEDTVRELEKLLLDEDCQAARRLVHTIRGVTATIGARRLEKAAEALESALGQESDERIRFVVQEFNRNFSWVIADLHRVLNAPQVKSEVAAGKNEGKPVEIVLREIRELVTSGSPEALEKLDQLDYVDLDAIDRQHLVALRRELENYEFSNAREILGQLLARF